MQKQSSAMQQKDIQLNKFYEADFIHEKLMFYYHTEFSNNLNIISFTDSECVNAIAIVEIKEENGEPDMMCILDYMLIHADAHRYKVSRDRVLNICDQISERLFVRTIDKYSNFRNQNRR